MSLKRDTADCSIEMNTKIRMIKKRLQDIINIWKDVKIGR